MASELRDFCFSSSTTCIFSSLCGLDVAQSALAYVHVMLTSRTLLKKTDVNTLAMLASLESHPGSDLRHQWLLGVFAVVLSSRINSAFTLSLISPLQTQLLPDPP